MQSLEKTLPKMLEAKTGNTWMKFEHTEVYIRVNYCRIGDNPDGGSLTAMCIQIANINTPERYQGKGTFHRMIAKIQSMTNFPLYLENTKADFSEALIEKHGWTEVKQDIFGRYDLVLAGDDIKPWTGNYE